MKARLSLPVLLLALLLCSFGSSRAFAQMPELSPLPQTGTLTAPTTPKRFTFVVAGDNRPNKQTDPQPATPKLIFKAVKKLKPAFVFWTGDTIYGKLPCDSPGSCDKSVIEKQYNEFLALAASANAPVFNAPGNHEMDNDKNVPNATMQELYVQYMGAMYGAFNYGNSRFISINTDEIAAPGVTQPENGYVSDAVIQQLAQDLEANKGMKHIFIFMHRPIKPLKSDDGLSEPSAGKLKDLFKQYGNVVAYVLAGHEHLYFNALGKKSNGTAPPPDRTSKSTKPFYLVSGGAGAPFKKTCPAGSFHHYLVFDVKGKTINATLVKINDQPCVPKKAGSDASLQ